MSENSGVIWVLLGALVLGIAIFAMGKYFASHSSEQSISIAFQHQSGIDELACEKQDPTTDGKEWQYTMTQLTDINHWDTNDSGTWTGNYPTGDCIEVII